MLNFIQIENFRNIKSSELHCHPTLNWIIGENGSGKTSLLESIHCLSSARSFRSHNPSHFITHNHDHTHVFAQLGETRLGVGFVREGGKEIHVNGEKVRVASELAVHLPVQVLTPKVSQLIEGGPGERRRFLDWGLFHVEQSYRGTLARFNRVLKQRNSLIKTRASLQQVKAWNPEFIQLAEELTQQREDYVSKLTQMLAETLPSITELPALHFKLYRGWPEKLSLSQAITESWHKEQQRGQSQYGPQRADLRIHTDSALAKDELSRGQLKLLSSMMLLCQLQLLEKIAKRAVLLIDDIGAEFDIRNRSRILQMALDTGAQLFVTATSKPTLEKSLTEYQSKMFHVEHGVFMEME